MRLIVVKIFKELNVELAANKWQLGQCEQILGVGMQLSELFRIKNNKGERTWVKGALVDQMSSIYARL